MKKRKIAIVRGKFLNKCEIQTFEYLPKRFDINAFASLTSSDSEYSLPITKLPSPMDLPDVPFKMPILNRMFTDAHCLFGLEDELKGYDIAHTAETYFHYTKQCIEAKRKGHVKKVVVTVLENIPFANEGIQGRKQFKKLVYKNADLFLPTTIGAKKALLEEGVDKKKIQVFYSGVDTDIFKPAKHKSNKCVNLLFVGRIEYYKGIYNIFEAFVAIKKDKKFKNLQLTIVGDGSKKNNIIKKIKEAGLGKSVDLKVVPYADIHKEYQKADIFLAPSIDTNTWKEQFGYAIVEAMACGLPIITTDAGSLPEVTRRSCINVEQDSTPQIKSAIESLLMSSKKRKELGILARKNAVKYYNSKKQATKLAKIYDSL